MFSVTFRRVVIAAAVAAITASAPPVRAAGSIDANTVIVIPHGTFGGMKYNRYEAMFQGISSAKRAYRTPCQIIAPANPDDSRGLCLFDWLNSTAIFTAIRQEWPIARIAMTDEFLFGHLGASYGTVRGDPAGIGKPWSDGRLSTSTEFIQSAGDEFDTVADFVTALRTDPVAVHILGTIDRMVAFGESSSGTRLRGLLRLQMGEGLFDFALVGGAGHGFSFPTGNDIGFREKEAPPLAGAGLEIDFNTEADVLARGADDTRHIDANYRAYEFAGCAHVPGGYAGVLGLPNPDTANPADWVPFVRALFVAGINWCDGIEPPPSVWLGTPKDATIARDAKGNALVTYVGGEPVDTTGYRLPEVAVGENQYIALDPSFNDGSLLGLLRFLSGGFVDLTATFASHSDYVKAITADTRALEALGYLLPQDADAIIHDAEQSDIGK